MHLLSLAGLETVIQRQQNREGAVVAGTEVVHGEALHERLLVATPAQLAAGDSLAQLFAPAATRPKARLAECADGRVDDVWPDPADVFVTAAKPLGDTTG